MNVQIFATGTEVSVKRKEFETMSYTIPKDPNMLFSYINMMLRDRYSSLEEFCTVNDADAGEITAKLEAAGYHYDENLNQFR